MASILTATASTRQFKLSRSSTTKRHTMPRRKSGRSTHRVTSQACSVTFTSKLRWTASDTTTPRVVRLWQTYAWFRCTTCSLKFASSIRKSLWTDLGCHYRCLTSIRIKASSRDTHGSSTNALLLKYCTQTAVSSLGLVSMSKISTLESKIVFNSSLPSTISTVSYTGSKTWQTNWLSVTYRLKTYKKSTKLATRLT